MRRSQIETKYLKTKTHKNVCIKFYKRERRKHYYSLDMKSVLDSIEIWKMRPFLSDKKIVFSQICIEKNNRIISGHFNLPQEFVNFFEDAVRLPNVKHYLSHTENLYGPAEIAIK